MSKWRPSEKNCLYVIPDIHGGQDVLQKILDRILPLRKSDGGKDRIIFLGDYIDRHPDSHKVLDTCIQLQKEYGPQVTFIMGNHELIFLQAFNLQLGRNLTLQTRNHMYHMWLMNGGLDTIRGYLDRAGLEENPISFPQYRVIDLVPKEHISFMQNLEKGYELDDFVFVHGGLNPLEPMAAQELELLAWDRKLVKYVVDALTLKKPLEWEKTVVVGHSVMKDRMPIIADKFLMLDCGSPKQLLVVEMRSREAFMSYPDKDRLVKYELELATRIAPAPRPSFRRVT